MSLKVSVFAASSAIAQKIARDVQALHREAEVHAAVGDSAAACADLVHRQPDILLIERQSLSPADLGAFERALAQRPLVTVILLTADRSAETLLAAMRAGIREVIQLPLLESEFTTAMTRQLDRLKIGRAAGQHQGVVIAFMPVKGGSGATFLATSFGHALSTRGKRVAVIDLNLHLGDASIFVSDKPVTTTMADLAQQEHRLDSALLESVMLVCGDNFWLLASPESPDAAVGIRADTVARVIALACSRFDYVILDMGRVPDAVTLRALDAAQTVYVVAQATMPFLHDGKRLLTLLRELGYPQDKLQLVINRVEKGGDLSSNDVRKTLNFSHAREIPNSYAAVAYAINHGLPLLRHAPRDPVAKALTSWADEWAPAENASRSGWLRGFGVGR